jgi:hypothetical protein
LLIVKQSGASPQKRKNPPEVAFASVDIPVGVACRRFVGPGTDIVIAAEGSDELMLDPSGAMKDHDVTKFAELSAHASQFV